MGNIEDGKEILNIRKTPALNRFLFFLRDTASQGEVDQSELEEIKSLMPVDEKQSFHLILSACLDDKELQQIFSAEGSEEISTHVSVIMEDDEMEKLSTEMYLDIVIGLELIEDCLCMVMTDPRLKIFREVSEMLTSKLTEGNGTTSISSILFDVITTCFVKLSRVEDEMIGNCYSKCLTDLVRCYVTRQFLEIGKCEKLITLFRIFGGAILNQEDYQNADEMSVLLDEWEFDKSISLMKHPSMKVYECLLNTTSYLWIQKRFDSKIVTALDNSIHLTAAGKRDENFNKAITVSSQELTLSSYLGGCAYLVQMIIERHSDSVKVDDIPNTLKCIKDFVKEKPKMKQEEVVGEIQDFSNFCERINKYGNREIYKRDWTIRFLSFSPEEIIGTVEGNAIAEAFIIGAESDLVMECVKKIRDVDKNSLDLDDSRKELILKIITQERSSKHETQEFINEFFQDGANDTLQMGNFKEDLHVLSLQLGNIEFEKDPSKLAKHELAVIRLCMQNPAAAISKILDQSVRTEHFRALAFASPFFNLKIPVAPVNEEVAETDTDVSTVLIVHCFSRMIKYLPEYPNSVYDSLSNSMEGLISLGIISAADIFGVVKFHIVRFLSGNSKISLQIVVGLVSLLENLIKLASDSLMNEMGGFVINLNRFFCYYTNSTNFPEVVKIKNMLVCIIRFLSTTDVDFNCEITNKTDVEDLSLFDQGTLYVRCEQFRSVIKNLLETGTDDLSFKEFVQINILPWILNSTEEQWSTLIDFIFNVTLSPSSKLYRVKNVNKMNLLNEVLLLMYTSCVESKCTDAFLHTVRFYGVAVEVIQGQFDVNEWHSLFNTLLTISVEMNKGKKRAKGYHTEVIGLHQILSYALSKIEEFAKLNRSLDGCDQLTSKLGMIAHLDAKCEPIRWLISEKLTYLQSSCSA